MTSVLTLLKTLEREAGNVSEPEQIGVWTVSPKGIRFVTQLQRDHLTGQWRIGWFQCNAGLVPSLFGFRLREV